MQNENEGESLFDAINAAIPSENAPEGDEPEQEEVAEGEEVEGEETPDGEEEAEGEEGGEGEAEGEEDADGEEEADDEDPEAAAAAKAPKTPAKEPDPINDPLPRGTLQSTADRFKHVVDKLKEQTAARETAETQYNELVEEITGAGMDGTTFGYMLEYARGVNSNTYEGLQKSYQILMKELQGVAAALGEPLPGEDVLKGHADLAAEVAAKTLTQERALEIAKQRNRAAAQTKLTQGQQHSQQSAQQQQQAVATGKQSLTALGKELAAKDGVKEYTRKAALVVAMLKDVLPNVSPKLWAKTFRNAYDKVPAAPKAAAPAGGGKKLVKPQPLRGNKVPSGQSSKAPKTLRQAIDVAFE